MLRRDELMDPSPAIPREPEDQPAGLVSGVFAAVWCGLPVLVITLAPLLAGLTELKRSLIAADERRRRHPGDNWEEVWTPIMLFVFFGAIFGAAVAWRVAAKTGMSGSMISLPVALLGVALSAAALIYVAATFGTGVPVMCVIALAVLTGSAVAGAMFYTKWTN
jgi:hypothetical protein